MPDTDLAPLKRMVIERACEQLSIAYARAVDFRDYDAFVELFADDALLDLGMQIKGKTGDPRVDAEAFRRDPVASRAH